MKLQNRFSICFVMIIIFLGSLQSTNQTVNDNQDTRKRLIGAEDIISISSYLYSSTDAHKKYLEKNKIEPQIKCKKCTTKLLSLSEFDGGLVGWALKNLADGKVSFEKIKSIFDDCLKVISEGSPSDVINYMVSISNGTQQACSHCQSHSISWEKIDI